MSPKLRPVTYHVWSEEEIRTTLTMSQNGKKPVEIQKKLPHLTTSQIANKIYSYRKKGDKISPPEKSFNAENEDGIKSYLFFILFDHILNFIIIIVSRKRRTVDIIPLGPEGGEQDKEDQILDEEEDEPEEKSDLAALKKAGLIDYFVGELAIIITLRKVKFQALVTHLVLSVQMVY
jgi:hypothetical protein